jgi:serine/threonine protein kinase
MESEHEPSYTNKVDIWSIGCILYELATGTRAFQSDWAVLSYLHSQKKKDVVLDNTFDAHSIEIITKHIVDMLQINSSARPSASVLSKEFAHECQLIQVNHPISQQLNSVSSRITLGALSDDTEQTQSMLQNNQVIVTEGDNSTPNLPSRLIGGGSLYSAAQKGDVEAVKILLNATADVNAQGGLYGNALQAASRNGDEAVVRLLLDKGADVNAQGGLYGNALQAASQMGDEAVVRLLLDKGAVYVRD